MFVPSSFCLPSCLLSESALTWSLCGSQEPESGLRIWKEVKAETPVLWPPHAKSWLIGKDSDAGRGWGQEKKGTTEDEMAGWHHWLDGRESEWTPRVGDGQGGLACCDSWGSKESDTTERLNWTELNWEQYPASQVALVVKNLHVNAGDTRDEGSIPRWGKIPWRRAWQPTPVFLPGKLCSRFCMICLKKKVWKIIKLKKKREVICFYYVLTGSCLFLSKFMCCSLMYSYIHTLFIYSTTFYPLTVLLKWYYIFTN